MKEFEQKLPEICEYYEENFLACFEEAKRSGGMLQPEEAEHMDNLAHTIKSLCAVKHEKAHESEKIGEYGRGYPMENGNYGRQRRSQTTGRYMDGGYNDGYGRMYRDDGNEQVMEHLREAMDKCQDQGSRRILESAMRKFESM